MGRETKAAIFLKFVSVSMALGLALLGCATSDSRNRQKSQKFSSQSSSSIRPSVVKNAAPQYEEERRLSENPDMDEVMQLIADQSIALCTQLRGRFADQYAERMADRKDLHSDLYLESCGALFQANVLDCVDESSGISSQIPAYLSTKEKVEILSEIQKRKKSCAEDVPLKTASQMVFHIEYSIYLRKNLSETAQVIVEDPFRFARFLQGKMRKGFKPPVTI